VLDKLIFLFFVALHEKIQCSAVILIYSDRLMQRHIVVYQHWVVSNLICHKVVSIPSVSVLNVYTYGADAKLWWVVRFHEVFRWPIFTIIRGMPD
jgi:hypothetical protein